MEDIKNKDYESGVVRCIKCGEILGNYKTDDYFKLIRLKYCPSCNADVIRETQRKAAKKRRERKRIYYSELEKKASLLEIENKALRVKLFGTDNDNQALKLQDLLKEMAEIIK